MRIEYTKNGEKQTQLLYFKKTGERVGFKTLLELKESLDDVERRDITDSCVVNVPMYFIIGDDVLHCEYQLSYDNEAVLSHAFVVKEESIGLEKEHAQLLDATRDMFTTVYENLYFVV